MTNETSNALPAGMEACVVAPGRSVTSNQVVGSEMREGALVPKLEPRIYRPGESVVLLAEDAQQLRQAGYVIDPNNPPDQSRFEAGLLPPTQPSINGKIVSPSYHRG